MSMESPDCHPARLLWPLYLGHDRDAFEPPKWAPRAQQMHAISHPRDLTGNPRSELGPGFGPCAGAGRGGPRVWVGQPLIISCPVITWQTVLVSQAGIPTVSAVEPVEQSFQRGCVARPSTVLTCPCQSAVGFGLARYRLQPAAGED